MIKTIMLVLLFFFCIYMIQRSEPTPRVETMTRTKIGDSYEYKFTR